MESVVQDKLEQDMLSLSFSGDIVFQCQEEEIKAHRNILSARYYVLQLGSLSNNEQCQKLN